MPIEDSGEKDLKSEKKRLKYLDYTQLSIKKREIKIGIEEEQYVPTGRLILERFLELERKHQHILAPHYD